MKAKKVLIIGDSISIGYTPHVQRLLAGRLEVVHHEGNAGDTRRIGERLDAWLAADGDADVIHFNSGLHDIKLPRDGSGHQVPLPQYRENLARIVDRLRDTGKALIWASTTPVIFEWHAAAKPFDRGEEDVVAYNAAAEEIVSQAGIPIDDLHAVMHTAGPDRYLRKDGVHFTDEGYALLAEAVAKAILDSVA